MQFRWRTHSRQVVPCLRACAANWPIREQHFLACSPDLSVLDYALWSLIEQKVREHEPERCSATRLKAAISKACHYFNTEGKETLDAAADGFPARCRACVEAAGGHFESLSNKLLQSHKAMTAQQQQQQQQQHLHGPTTHHGTGWQCLARSDRPPHHTRAA